MFLIAGCGAGDGTGDGGTSYDREGATGKVGEGVALLETTLDGYIADLNNPDIPNPSFPYPGTVQVKGLFEDGVTLDPTYDQAGFWAAVFELIAFLQSADTQAFLAKLGWQDLTTPSAEGYEFDEFSGRIGQTYDETLGTPDPAAPAMNAFFLPSRPEWEDSLDPAYNPVILGGTDPYVDVRFDELHSFVTQKVAGSARRAVDRLKALPPDFSTSLALWDDTAMMPHVFVIDRFEAKVVQAFYGVLEVVATLPALWKFPRLDEFISGSSHRDPVTGQFIDPDTGETTGTVDDIADAELVDYIRNGYAGGGLPLSANPTGIARVKQALADLLEAVESAFHYLVSTADMSGHLFDLDLVFGTYDDEPAVVRYSLKAGEAMAAEARTALVSGSASAVNVYRPVAFIQDFSNTCTVGGNSTAPTTPGNTPGTGLPATLDLAGTVTDLGTLSADPASVTSDVPGGTVFNGDGTAYYFQVTLPAAMNLSIFSTSADASVDLAGDVGYVTDPGTGAVTWWDGDADSGADLNFGLSIDADWFGTELPTPGVTLVIRVAPVASGDFTLHVVAATDGNWPVDGSGNPTEPIFLKGGGGRQFRLETWRMGGVTVNLGAAVSVLGGAFDLIDRSQFDLVDDPATTDVVESNPVLIADKATVRTKILSVFPQADFAGSALETNGTADLYQLPLDFSIPGIWPLSPSTPAAEFGTVTFCANPQDLSRSAEHAGGFAPLF